MVGSKRVNSDQIDARTKSQIRARGGAGARLQFVAPRPLRHGRADREPKTKQSPPAAFHWCQFSTAARARWQCADAIVKGYDRGWRMNCFSSIRHRPCRPRASCPLQGWCGDDIKSDVVATPGRGAAPLRRSRCSSQGLWVRICASNGGKHHMESEAETGRTGEARDQFGEDASGSS